MKLYPPPNTNKLTLYENVPWDGNIKKKFKTIYNCKHCITVDLILKHNQKGSMLGRVRYIIYLINMKPASWRHMKRCHGRLHYNRKFQIFLFLIGYINVNKDVFCSIISYLRIKVIMYWIITIVQLARVFL